MTSRFGLVDLFAGPGGLGEGFASHGSFHIGLSIEKEASAHRTLTLRAFLRNYRDRHGTLPAQFVDFHAGRTTEPEWRVVDEEAWREAIEEAHCLELGTDAATSALDRSVRKLRRDYDDTVLIGGPPCQAYSLVGRARAKGIRGYVPEKDARHYLFREYISVLDRLRPAAFVMENVKGMLSSTVESRLVFAMLMDDLSSLGTRRRNLYELRAIRVEDGRAYLYHPQAPSDFVIRAEDFGVPQRRHRVIIVGIRSDLVAGLSDAAIHIKGRRKTVADVISNLPRLRSGLSRSPDNAVSWREKVTDSAKALAKIYTKAGALGEAFKHHARTMKNARLLPRSSHEVHQHYGQSGDELLQWLERPDLDALAQHETRGHMGSDLTRYLFAAEFGNIRGFSPKASDFAPELSPDHVNWHSGIFADRFRVQLANDPSTTVTSHISKDGHYFIHPDPTQCRSLTVREAARLQTFPDDYFFLGNRTQQYVQVGNAVPPYLARQIAQLLLCALGYREPTTLVAPERDEIAALT